MQKITKKPLALMMTLCMLGSISPYRLQDYIGELG